MKDRKQIRIKEFNYSRNGMYYITICSNNRKEIFSEISVGARCSVPKKNKNKINKNWRNNRR